MPDDTAVSADAPDLVASTGVNDASSPWNGLLQSALQIGGTALTGALAGQTPVTAPSSSAPGNSGSPPPSGSAAAPGGQAKSIMPWAIAGVLVIALIWFFGRGK